jgi:hypothetical protein
MAEASSLTAYRTLETRYVILQYRSLEDLEGFEDEIDFSGGVFGNLFSSSDAKDLQVNVKTEVDALYRRVQKILDMQKKMNKVNIKIHRNSEELKRAFRKTYGRGRRGVPRTWFRYENNTIYVNLDDVHEGMLAHEMAHAIIDNYLLVKPPRATAEILARYVDRHLLD